MIFVAVSTGHFDPLIRRCSELHKNYDFRAQIGSGKVVPPFAHFRTAAPKEIYQCMQEAELVITHAGTGMLSMLYELKKKSIVIPKQKRYGEANDGQVELARKWDEIGMSVLCMDVDRLAEAIRTCRQKEFHFPALPKLGLSLEREFESFPDWQPALAQN